MNNSKSEGTLVQVTFPIRISLILIRLQQFHKSPIFIINYNTSTWDDPDCTLTTFLVHFGNKNTKISNLLRAATPAPNFGAVAGEVVLIDSVSCFYFFLFIYYYFRFSFLFIYFFYFILSYCLVYWFLLVLKKKKLV